MTSLWQILSHPLNSGHKISTTLRLVTWKIFQKVFQQDVVATLSDSTSKSQTSFLITALPSSLYDAYASNLTYRLLPLSPSQEFASKGEWVWGSSTRINPITNVKLRSFFHLLLEENNRVFITNAYITHSREVISDYEQLKNEFEFFPLNEGCQHTCDLFELKLKK